MSIQEFDALVMHLIRLLALVSEPCEGECALGPANMPPNLADPLAVSRMYMYKPGVHPLASLNRLECYFGDAEAVRRATSFRDSETLLQQ